MKPNILRIIVVDNDQLIQNLYKAYFETYSDYELAGTYGSVTEALEDYDTMLLRISSFRRL